MQPNESRRTVSNTMRAFTPLAFSVAELPAVHLLCTVCAWLLLAMPAPASASDDGAAADPFLTDHRAAVARNASIVKLTARFTQGRQTYRIGERIEIDLVFTPGLAKDESVAAKGSARGHAQMG